LKIWFDADNGPHVLIMRPLAGEFTRRGHQVMFTARDRTSTCELLDLYGFSYLKVGAGYGRGMSGKVRGTLGRAWALTRAMRGVRPQVSFGHGSRALPLAAKIMGVPTVTMYDYEWVDPRLFNWFCHSILMPEAITAQRCSAAGISAGKVVSYPGFKEELYLGGRQFDGAIVADLGLRPEAVKVLLRPPATTAHYHNPEAEVILDAILAKLAAVPGVQLVYLPRTPDQLALPKLAGVSEVIVPQKVYDGPSLVAAMDLVVSGGGTMTREAAIMGVPSYSFFRGRSGMVDEALAAAGKLTLLPEPGQVADRLAVEPKKGTAIQPDPGPMIQFICDAILAAAAKGPR
jgi:predicted glycosyltransferase